MDRGRRRQARLTSTGFLVLPEDVARDRVFLKGQESYHAARVCRCRTGDGIDVTDGAGMSYRCRVLSCTPALTEAAIQESLPEHGEPRARLILAIAPVKGERFDWLVEKAVEAGAGEILPVITDRSVAEPRNRADRWRRLALAALKQTRRSRLTPVSDPEPFPEALPLLAARVGLLLVAHEGPEAANDLSDALPATPVASVGVLVGPEGGFSDKELSMAASHGARTFSLGPRRLRTETAGVLAVSLILYELGRRA